MASQLGAFQLLHWSSLKFKYVSSTMISSDVAVILTRLAGATDQLLLAVLYLLSLLPLHNKSRRPP
jgi:hypothetical protein